MNIKCKSNRYMKNSYGFTLIELLASMIILGIITVIAVQTYYAIIENNDESKYNYYMDLVKEGANLYFEGQKSFLKSGECLTVTYQTLLEENYIKEEDVKCEGTGIIQLQMKGKKAVYNLENLSCTSGRFKKESKELFACDIEDEILEGNNDADLILAWSYIGSGTKPSSFPKKGEGYQVTNVECTGGNGTFNPYTWKVDVEMTANKAECNLTVTDGNTSEQVLTANSSNILEDKTALTVQNNELTLLTGTMKNRGKLDWAPEEATTFSVPSGYYSGGTLSTENAYNAGFDAGKAGIEDSSLTLVAESGWLQEGVTWTCDTEPGLILVVSYCGDPGTPLASFTRSSGKTAQGYLVMSGSYLYVKLYYYYASTAETITAVTNSRNYDQALKVYSVSY